MSQKFLSIKNFEKYQHFKKANPPWIKLYRSLFTDREFMRLPVASKYVYIGIVMLASEGSNRVPHDLQWISQRLSIPPSEIDLKPLYKAGFFIASESTVYRESISQRRDREETETEKSKPSRVSLTDDEWWEELKKNPAYSHIDLERENGKMDAWFTVPKNSHRKKNREFILNWLNKVEAPMKNGNGMASHAPIPPFPGPEDPIARGQWRKMYGDPANPQRRV